MSLFRKKYPEQSIVRGAELQRSLSALDLTLMGIGVIVGAGVFVLTGVAAATKAGPAITLSYVIAGFASILTALAYAELATAIGGCGSAYNYTYAGFGEFAAWLIGWNLLFEYTLAVATISIGWSGYVNDALTAFGIHLPANFIKNPFEGGWINLPAALIIVLLGILLCIGLRQSVRFNSIVVVIKLITITAFIVVASQHVNLANWEHFLPFGWHGVMQGAALVFFAYIGFDALSTAAEETVNPQRNLPLSIIASVMICAAIYVIVAGLLTTVVPYTTLDVKSPVTNAILTLGYPLVAGMIAVGAIAGLTTGMLVMYYGLSRLTLAMARDGLLPTLFAKVSTRTQTPKTIIIISGIIMVAVAGFVPLDEAAELVNIGTLAAFTIVCAGVIALRILRPDLARPFKLPWNPLIPGLGIICCLYLMYHLPALTWWRFLVWIVIGLVIYFLYGYKNSILHSRK